jgi:hypothetical protein
MLWRVRVQGPVVLFPVGSPETVRASHQVTLPGALFCTLSVSLITLAAGYLLPQSDRYPICNTLSYATRSERAWVPGRLASFSSSLTRAGATSQSCPQDSLLDDKMPGLWMSRLRFPN